MGNEALLKRVNNVLLALIILINLYVILAPFAPSLIYYAKSHSGVKTKLQHDITSGLSKDSSPQSNHIIIPSMLLNAPIYEGSVANQYSVLNRGIWHFPSASSPNKGGNTVLIGHRFTYTKPEGIFYYLNKVKIGDQMAVWWSNREYVYKVTSVTTVNPSDTAIENNSIRPELTIFTCTPLLLPKDRLVIVASLESKS